MLRGFAFACLLIAWSMTLGQTESADVNLQDLAIERLLQGRYDEADRIARSLEHSHPGDALTLQLIVSTTELSWREDRKDLDASIDEVAKSLLTRCRLELGQPLPDERANYYCGQAHFALAYLRSLRRKPLSAAQHTRLAVRHLRTSISTSPALVDAGLPLGLLYYYVDNLPPFARAVGRTLRFLPRGNSGETFALLQQVSEDSSSLGDAARFMISELQVQQGRSESALTALKQLVLRYPRNFRLHYNLVEALYASGQHGDALTQLRIMWKIANTTEQKEMTLRWQSRIEQEPG